MSSKTYLALFLCSCTHKGVHYPFFPSFLGSLGTNSISTIKPAIMGNMERSIVKTRASFFDLKVGLSLDHDASLRFVTLLALQTCWEPFQVMNNIRSAPASSAHILVSHQSHNVCTANRHLYSSGERNGANRRTKVILPRCYKVNINLVLE